MSQFRTVLKLKPALVHLTYQKNIVSVGSCFAEHIGQRLFETKFPININPFGILYHPLVIQKTLQEAINKRLYQADDMFQHNDLWHTYARHSNFSSLDKVASLNKINESLTFFIENLPDTLIITLGTAYGFYLKETNELVANCHKMPNHLFDRKLSPPKEIISNMLSTFQQLKMLKPNLNIILTVSPVRHIRDGLVENQRSKATLLLACHELVGKLDFVDYFPAYELLIDELRDYRFYKKDMIHPSEVAVDFIWESFQQKYVENENRVLITQFKKLQQAKNHRPINSKSIKYHNFVKKQLQIINKFKKEYPYLKFEAEEQFFKKQLE